MSIVEDALVAIKIYAPDIVKELVLKPIAESGLDKLLHISNNPNIAVFTPIVPKRAGEGEDLRIPRICTASSLTGCVIGYNGVVQDFYNTEEGFKCEYTIYAFKPPVVVKPSNKLLPPVEITGERWIIAHANNTEYVPEIIGKLTIIGVQSHPTLVSGKTVIEDNLEFVLEVKDGHNVSWTVGVPPLEAGHYYIKANKLPNWGYYQENVDYRTYSLSDNAVIKNITKEDYVASLQSVGLLDRQIMPSYLKW